MPNCANCRHSKPSNLFNGEKSCEMGMWFGNSNMPLDDIECTVFTPDINDQAKVSIAEVSASALVVVEAFELAMSLLDQAKCPKDTWNPGMPPGVQDEHRSEECMWCQTYLALKEQQS